MPFMQRTIQNLTELQHGDRIFHRAIGKKEIYALCENGAYIGPPGVPYGHRVYQAYYVPENQLIPCELTPRP